jgi:hypothetical protein
MRPFGRRLDDATRSAPTCRARTAHRLRRQTAARSRASSSKGSYLPQRHLRPPPGYRVQRPERSPRSQSRARKFLAAATMRTPCHTPCSPRTEPTAIQRSCVQSDSNLRPPAPNDYSMRLDKLEQKPGLMSLLPSPRHDRPRPSYACRDGRAVQANRDGYIRVLLQRADVQRGAAGLDTARGDDPSSISFWRHRSL